MAIYVWLLTVIYLMRYCHAVPVRITIECGVDDKNILDITRPRNVNTLLKANDFFNVDGFCDMIRKSLPHTVRHGRVHPKNINDLITMDDTFNPISIPPPKGFKIAGHLENSQPKPRFKLPRLKIPKISVPNLKSPSVLPKHAAPTVGDSMIYSINKKTEESSAEKIDKFKKSIQKMLHVVKVIGQIDQYLSERARIVIDKVSKTLE